MNPAPPVTKTFMTTSPSPSVKAAFGSSNYSYDTYDSTKCQIPSALLRSSQLPQITRQGILPGRQAGKTGFFQAILAEA